MPELIDKELPKQAYPIIIWQAILSDTVSQAMNESTWQRLDQFITVTGSHY
jgi:hypothetical protein